MPGEKETPVKKRPIKRHLIVAAMLLVGATSQAQHVVVPTLPWGSTRAQVKSVLHWNVVSEGKYYLVLQAPSGDYRVLCEFPLPARTLVRMTFRFKTSPDFATRDYADLRLRLCSVYGGPVDEDIQEDTQTAYWKAGDTDIQLFLIKGENDEASLNIIYTSAKFLARDKYR
jgi:hypothetical protein